MSLTSLIYSNLKKIAESFGFNLVISRAGKKGEYEIILPSATYAPWLSDKHFQRTFSLIRDYTLVDKYGAYGLWQLVAESKKLNGALLEVGAWRGGTAALIAKSAELKGIRDTIYVCDTFNGVVKAGINDSFYKGGEYADTSQKIVEKLLFKKLKLRNIKILHGTFPDDTANFVREDKFRFCHIDVDVYQSAKDITSWLWPKMVVGGIIVYDDYGFSECDGVTKFVNEEKKQKDRIVIYNLNSQAIVIKTK